MKKILFVIILAAIGISACGKKNTETADNRQNNTQGKVESVSFKCKGMYCTGCEETITSEVKKIDGVKEIKADSKAKLVTVSFDESRTNKETISKAINTAGYETELTKSDTKQDYDTKEKKN